MKEILARKKSEIDGLGIFTNEDITKNEEFYKDDNCTILNHSKKRCAYAGKNRWIEDTKILNWINHSCDANMKVLFSQKGFALRAKRTIKKGEEITCNYNETEKGGEKVLCTCNANKCKGHFTRVE